MAYVDLWVGVKEGILASHNIAKSKTGSEEMQVIHFDQECASVGNFFKKSFLILNIFYTPLNMTLSLFDGCL